MTELLATPELFASVRGETYDPTDLASVVALEAASDLVRGYCNQRFAYVEDDEVILRGTGRVELLLPELPVVELTQVADHTPGGEDSILEADEYLLSTSAVVHRLGGSVWPRNGLVAVTYSHGYHLPGTPAIDTPDVPELPSDLQLAVCSIAGRAAAVGGVASSGPIEQERIGQYEVTYGSGSSSSEGRAAMISVERNVLDRYRRVRIV